MALYPATQYLCGSIFRYSAVVLAISLWQHNARPNFYLPKNSLHTTCNLLVIFTVCVLHFYTTTLHYFLHFSSCLPELAVYLPPPFMYSRPHVHTLISVKHCSEQSRYRSKALLDALSMPFIRTPPGRGGLQRINAPDKLILPRSKQDVVVESPRQDVRTEIQTETTLLCSHHRVLLITTRTSKHSR